MTIFTYSIHRANSPVACIDPLGYLQNGKLHGLKRSDLYNKAELFEFQEPRDLEDLEQHCSLRPADLVRDAYFGETWIMTQQGWKRIQP